MLRRIPIIYRINFDASHDLPYFWRPWRHVVCAHICMPIFLMHTLAELQRDNPLELSSPR